MTERIRGIVLVGTVPGDPPAEKKIANISGEVLACFCGQPECRERYIAIGADLKAKGELLTVRLVVVEEVGSTIIGGAS